MLNLTPIEKASQLGSVLNSMQPPTSVIERAAVAAVEVFMDFEHRYRIGEE